MIAQGPIELHGLTPNIGAATGRLWNSQRKIKKNRILIEPAPIPIERNWIPIERIGIPIERNWFPIERIGGFR